MEFLIKSLSYCLSCPVNRIPTRTRSLPLRHSDTRRAGTELATGIGWGTAVTIQGSKASSNECSEKVHVDSIVIPMEVDADRQLNVPGGSRRGLHQAQAEVDVTCEC